MGLEERDDELDALSELVAAAREGGGVAVIEGPAGIGKSTLLQALVEACAAGGTDTLVARATRLGGEVPFGLARRLLEPVVRARPQVTASGWAQRCRPLFDGAAEPAGATAALVEGLVALVEELHRVGGPLVLILDDVQWSDPASLAFVVELAERHREVGVGLAVTIGADPDPRAERALVRLRALAGERLLAPAPLSPTAVRRLAAAAGTGWGEREADELATASAGNPLLVRELLAGHRPGEQLPVAPAIVDLARARLERLGRDAHVLAEATAVLAETPLHRAAALAGLHAGAADAAADALIEREVLTAGPPLRFTQPILADALLSTIAPFELAARHRRAAELLAAEGAGDDDVAVHLMRSRPNDDAWASGVLCRAARAALGRGDPSRAAAILERALAEPPPAAEREGLLIELAQAQAAAGRPEAVAAFETTLAQVRDPQRRARAWHGLSRALYLRGEHREAAQAAARGRDELPDGDPFRERLLADQLAGEARVPELLEEAAATADALLAGDPPRDPALLGHLILHAAWRGLEVDRLPELARAAVADDPLIDPDSGGFALTFVAGALNMVDETELSCELLGAGLERVARRGDPLAEANLRCNRAWAWFYRGRLDMAQRDLDEVQTLNQLGWPAVEALLSPPRIVWALERDDLAGARAALARTPINMYPGGPWFTGAVAAAAGDDVQALAAFEQAGAVLEGVLKVGNPGVLPWRSSAALSAARLGRTEEARQLLAPELTRAQELRIPRAVGIALRVSGFVEDDPELLERSIDVLERSSAHLQLGYSLLFLGAAHRRARRLRDARDPLQRALAVAEECGSLALARRTRDELRAAGARPRNRPVTGPRSLTASEHNVAQLAASGRTTRQIAAELYLTPKTVEGHLTRVYRKLRISSRAEIAGRLGGSRVSDELQADPR